MINIVPEVAGNDETYPLNRGISPIIVEQVVESDLTLGIPKQWGIRGVEFTMGPINSTLDFFQEPLFSLRLENVTVREALNAIAHKTGRSWTYNRRYLGWGMSSILEAKPDAFRPRSLRPKTEKMRKGQEAYLKWYAAKDDSLKGRYLEELEEIMCLPEEPTPTDVLNFREARLWRKWREAKDESTKSKYLHKIMEIQRHLKDADKQ